MLCGYLQSESPLQVQDPASMSLVEPGPLIFGVGYH